MDQTTGICLQSHFVNEMVVKGELGWFSREDSSASTGYRWSCIPDDSGVYELVETVTLHPSTNAVGVPGMLIWKFTAVKAGKGSITFQLARPWLPEPYEKIVVTIEAHDIDAQSK
jgi:predicted secreted protein